MVLDIQLFRKDQGGDPALVIESQRRRGKDEDKFHTVQAVLDADDLWRKCRYQLDREKELVNKLQREITKKKEAKESFTEIVEQRAESEKKSRQIGRRGPSSRRECPKGLKSYWQFSA